MIHKLKTAPEFFQAVWDEIKTAEWRKNDRNFKVGDSVNLQEFDRATGIYSGREILIEITHILANYHGMTDDYVMLSFEIHSWFGKK